MLYAEIFHSNSKKGKHAMTVSTVTTTVCIHLCISILVDVTFLRFIREKIAFAAFLNTACVKETMYSWDERTPNPVDSPEPIGTRGRQYWSLQVITGQYIHRNLKTQQFLSIPILRL